VFGWPLPCLISSSPQFNFGDNSEFDLLVLQKLELYGLAGVTFVAALRLDNHHSLCSTLLSPLFCFGFQKFWFKLFVGGSPEIGIIWWLASPEIGIIWLRRRSYFASAWRFLVWLLSFSTFLTLQLNSPDIRLSQWFSALADTDLDGSLEPVLLSSGIHTLTFPA